MPRGKEFCPFENDFVDAKTIKLVDGTRLHDVEPLHRITDGLRVRIENNKVVEVDPEDTVIDALGEE